MNCIGAGVSKFGSWNNGNVELGTQSYSNVIIGAGGSVGNARTTTIKGTISVTGNGGTATNLWGSSRFVNFAATNTITPPIDINYFVLVTGTVASTVNLPSYINRQQIIVRNSKQASVGVTINPVSGQNILNLVTITSYNLAQGGSVTFYCDGTRWIIMRN